MTAAEEVNIFSVFHTLDFVSMITTWVYIIITMSIKTNRGLEKLVTCCHITLSAMNSKFRII